MTVVAAFLVPGSPLPLLKPENPPWGRIAAGYQRAGRALAQARPDTILLYSTQWLAVLDQLWQARPRVAGLHVDDNWYDYGDLPFDLAIDTELTAGCLAASAAAGISAKAVDYDGFPIDSGTITACRFLNGDGRLPFVLTSNNIYHDWAATERLGALAAGVARSAGRRIAVVGVGGLSGAMFREAIDIRDDRVASSADDRWNRRILELLERGDVAGVKAEAPRFAAEARADMGFKHLAFILGALGGRFYGARIHAYGPVYGSGAAVVEFRL
ncbi:MAG: tRNA U-34 5-methylaminomethyl-2-thiouridine biosynthesis protein [Alphaproteobacteria bacterium]|jgi:2-aminophenol/2-amino-5-chlorophenol 1,6-dioxygenase alpha subunit|nr:tRNA U-34 5-methylaminomethyl-2-thiouridine biosynthesis protein [Alphaproteobacteria bacterium]